jgi:hypothetical protein
VRGDPDISGALEHVLAVWTVWIHGRNCWSAYLY